VRLPTSWSRSSTSTASCSCSRRAVWSEGSAVPEPGQQRALLRGRRGARREVLPQGKSEGEPLAKVEVPRVEGGVFGNFIACVRSRQRENLCADILEGHLSSACCHLGNISYRLGRSARSRSRRPGQQRDHWRQHPDDAREHEGPRRGPGQNDAPGRAQARFNAATERFTDNAAANKLLTREYRPPFVVPSQV